MQLSEAYSPGRTHYVSRVDCHPCRRHCVGGLILTQTGALRTEVRRLADRLDALADRVARIEGQLDVLREMLEHFQQFPMRLKRRAGRPHSQVARPKQPLMTAPSRP